MRTFFSSSSLTIVQVVLLLALSSCHSKSEPFPSDPTLIRVPDTGFRLFSAPGTAGRAIRNLKKGEILHDLGEVSPFLTPLFLQGKSYVEPWLQVRTKNAEIGWVYGAVLYNLKGETAPQLPNKRLGALFGQSLAKKITRYAQRFHTVSSDQEMARTYRQFRELLDSLSLHTAFALAVNPTYTLPDLFWLPAVLPGVVPQMSSTADAYHFFAHYGVFKTRASTTIGKMDDEFFDWCIQQFPSDSIEYHYPRYTIETAAGKGHSLLGRGLHFQALQQMDSLYRRKTPFEHDLILLKNRCIDDISASKASFWEVQTKIIEELTQICQSDLVILTKADKIALETRLRQLEKPEKYGIRTDVQSGRTK
ncbi:SH3 domain-containing protein [Haliscomenobacter hydrossis]|uniref:SH3b domain-containing protein n=1 Tax=Haliscomenobacter hydrossis (strain ATCC 27775 / DSM 1100 / LMG 10767 / O) TaxID=760192 RepID=F4KTJ3_HALH1|nr:SH3 domain-containing protein [Haliscomenobacter hydrossis]AEE53367.1 hypothetical protein Halhy_5542 [Haliscomenobacter hydrossis DSM 1100]